MSESIFSRVVGLKSEDLSTEVLTAILDPADGNRTDRLIFFQNILRLPDFDIDRYQISTQEIHLPYGRPDIQIEDDKHIILIENKITADFTFNQIEKYIFILRDNYKDKKKHLIFLSPLKNQNEYLQKISKQLKLANISPNMETTINGIIFRSITWDKICSLLQSNDCIAKNLIAFMTENHLKTEKLEGADMDLLNSDKIPSILNIIWKVIENNRQYLSERNYRITRMSQSRTQYLFYVEFEWGNICIQYFLTFWAKYHSPFALQINSEKNFSSKLLEDIGYKYDGNYGYLYSIKIDSPEIENLFNTKVLDIIEKTNRAMNKDI